MGTTLALSLNHSREAAEELRLSERRLRTIIDASPVPHAVYDDRGRLTLLNPAFVSTFAYSLEDIPTLDTWWPKAYPDPDYRRRIIDDWMSLVEKARIRNGFETMEAKIRCKHGDIRTVLASAVALGESWVGSHLVILFDITEQVKSTHALTESNQLLHSILETLPIRVFWKDRDSRYLGCNTLFAKDAGARSVADLLGRDDRQLVWRDQAELYQADDRYVMESGECRLSYDEPQTTPSGDLIWLRTSKLPLRDANQNIIGVLGAYEDITARKQDERRLAESLSMLQATFEATADGILVVDLSGKITGYNGRFLELWNLPVEVLELGGDSQALETVLEQLLDPDGFKARVQELYANPELEGFDLLEFKDGKCLERYSRPQRIENTTVGRVWCFRDISVRKRVEEQLQWRTTFLEALLESSPDGIIAVDHQGRKLLQNHRTAELWAIPEAIARDGDDSAQVEFVRNQTLDPQAFADKVAYLYAHPEIESRDEIELRHGVILERYSSPVYDRLGKYYGRIWQFNDITEMRLAQRALQQRDYYQRALLDNFPFAVWLKDPDSRYLAVNRVYADSLGVGIQDIIGKSDVDLFAKDIAEQQLAEDRAVIDSRRQINIEQVVGHHGSETWQETYKAPLIDDQGNILGTVGFARDISYRKSAEEKLQLAALVYQNSSEAMVVTDADNKILTVNPAFSVITGYSADEVIGKEPNVLASGLHDQNFYRAMWSDIENVGSWRGEVKNCRKSGELYTEELTINTIFDDQGRPQRRVALFSDITKRKQSEEQIWLQANFDPLTGLPNRRMLRDRLSQELKKAHRMKQTFAVLFIDLDRFKEVNDTLGHEIGDDLLKDAAARLLMCVRESDTVARLGGDEFTIILSELSTINTPERVAEALLKRLSEPFHLGNEVVYVSASIGITVYPDDADDVGQLLKNADQAMYAAKDQGRNTYRFFTFAMQEALRIRAALLSDLRTALNEREFTLYYQPIVDLATGQVYKAEALLRWRHPRRGLISPVEFISLAEESGLINDIGDWVFKTAVEQLAEWRQGWHPDFQISVNKSPVQFQNPQHHPQDWRNFLHSRGLPGDGVVVEITEGLLLEATSSVADHLLAFRDAGIQVAIDDFGTGYSALSYLKKFDIDYLKIDQSFVFNLGEQSSDLALCEAIIVMAHRLGLKVVAEGVETELQRNLLLAVGCDYAQGYFYAKPLPADEFERQFSGRLV